MRIAITGHRPNKINNEYNGNGPMSLWIVNEIGKILDKEHPSLLISGMALGVDMLFAEMAIERNIDLLAAIPCEGQDVKWVEKSKNRYQKILSYKNCEKVILSKRYTPWCMQKRNEYMVDNCNLLIGVHDGTVGGTGNCLEYAKKVNRKIHIINPQDYFKELYEFI